MPSIARNWHRRTICSPNQRRYSRSHSHTHTHTGPHTTKLLPTNNVRRHSPLAYYVPYFFVYLFCFQLFSFFLRENTEKHSIDLGICFLSLSFSLSLILSLSHSLSYSLCLFFRFGCYLVGVRGSHSCMRAVWLLLFTQKNMWVSISVIVFVHKYQ